MAQHPETSKTMDEIWPPLKALIQRIVVLFIICFAIAMVLLNRNDNERLVGVRTLLLDVTVPILNVMAAPVDGYYRVKHFFMDASALYEKNQELAAENKKLKRMQSAIVAFEEENMRLKNALKLVGRTEYHYSTARIVGSGTGPYKSELLLNAGEADGIKAGQVVITDQGLLGRVLYVGKQSAKVLQVVDVQSHIPVTLGNPPVRAILSGNGTEVMRLQHMPSLPNVKPGAMVLTTGDAGALPPDIPVGVVSKVDTQQIYVSPVVDWHTLDYVQVLDYRAKDNTLAERLTSEAADASVKK